MSQLSHVSPARVVATLALVAAIPAALQAQQKKPAHHAAKASESQAALRAEAKISEAEARRIALAEVPKGTVRSSELEREHGALIYSFDIAVAGKKGIEEVNVNAIDGKVVAHEHESAAAERKEAKAEAREKRVKKP